MIKLRPFFCYYGGKFRIAPKYPTPQFDTVIEPFAGAAGYSVRHFHKRIKLIDSDPVICGLWKYLINVEKSEILRIPINLTHVNDLIGWPQETKWLVGFWMNKGAATPHLQPSRWMRDGTRPNSFWGEVIRQRIATQVEHIRHWQIFNSTYSKIPSFNATWFIDPPYQNPCGRHYRNSTIDYDHLGKWCKSRYGQVLVCESDGADWLPFIKFCETRATEGKQKKNTRSKEVIYVSTNFP